MKISNLQTIAVAKNQNPLWLLIQAIFGTLFLIVVTGCGPTPPPPPPRPEVTAMRNLYDSWNLGTASIAGQFNGARCNSEVKNESNLGDYVVCNATMKGYVHLSEWHCSTSPKGQCKMLR